MRFSYAKEASGQIRQDLTNSVVNLAPESSLNEAARKIVAQGRLFPSETREKLVSFHLWQFFFLSSKSNNGLPGQKQKKGYLSYL